jgi:hypothetical protein
LEHGVLLALAQVPPGRKIMQAEKNHGLDREADDRMHASPLAAGLPLGLALWLSLLVLILGALRLGG